MKTAMFPRAVTLILIAIAVAVLMLAGGGSGTSRAAHTAVEGDLLLDDGSLGGTNTATSLGTIQRQLCNIAPNSTVVIDVVAQGANDWLGMDFTVHFPSPANLTTPGDTQTAEAGPFDFVPFTLSPTFPIPPLFDNFGPQNFLIPDDASAPDAVYSTTEGVPDGSSPHGVSIFDGSITNGDSGSGGLAKITLDTTGLPDGEHTLLLSKDNVFSGGVHSETPPNAPPVFDVDNYGAFMLAVNQACSADDDLDGVSNDDEDTFGSTKNDHTSIPENADWLDGPTCGDGIDNDRDGFTDEKDIDCAPPSPPAFDKTMDLDAGSLPASLEITTPVTTQWHELFPNFSQPWALTSFDDVDDDGKLSPGDVIDMTHKGADGVVGGGDDGPPIFYVIEELTITIFLDELDGVTPTGVKSEREFFCDPGPPPAVQLCPNASATTMEAAIADPLGTFWHEVRPNFSEIWHLSSWTDDTSGDLSAGDVLDMTKPADQTTLGPGFGPRTDFLVDDISLDILLTVVPEPDFIPLCGTGVDLSFGAAPAPGLRNEIPGSLNDGSGLLCHYSTTIDTPTSSLSDDCIVGFPCDISTLSVVQRPPSTIQVPQPAARAALNPAVTILTGATFDFAADGDVTNGDVVGFIQVNIGSDAAILAECAVDLTLGPENLLDAETDASKFTGSPVDLFRSDKWPLQLNAEKAAVIAAFDPPGPTPSPLTLIGRSVTAFDVSEDVDGPFGPEETPLNILYFEFNPLFGELIPGEGNGGWVTVSFTADSIPEGGPVVPLPASGATLCTPFSAFTTVFGTSVGGSRYRTCDVAGTRLSITVIEPDALNATGDDEGTRFDVSSCSAHDSSILFVNQPSSGLKMKPNELVSKPFTIQIQNQSDHTDDIRVLVTVTEPTEGTCSVNGDADGPFVILDTVVTLDEDDKKVFVGPQTAVDFQCSDVPDGKSFAFTVELDHDDDGDLDVAPFLDNDDSDSSDNVRTKFLIVQEQ